MSQSGWPALLPLLFVACMILPARALEPAPGWPDTPEARRAAQAAIEALNSRLLAQASATATLEAWCADHGIAARGEVRAERVRDAEGPAPEEVRELLRAGPDTLVRHRRVQLRCGATVLSEADNFYLPERLTAQMNATLDDTDTPFGKVVRPLGFSRSTLEARLLWTPAKDAADAPAGARLAPPHFVLVHRAVLNLPDGAPFSALIERYTSGVLAFSPPAP